MDEAKKRMWQAPKLQAFGSLAGATLAGSGTVRELLDPQGDNGCMVGMPTNTMKYPCG